MGAKAIKTTDPVAALGAIKLAMQGHKEKYKKKIKGLAVEIDKLKTIIEERSSVGTEVAELRGIAEAMTDRVGELEEKLASGELLGFGKAGSQIKRPAQVCFESAQFKAYRDDPHRETYLEPRRAGVEISPLTLPAGAWFKSIARLGLLEAIKATVIDDTAIGDAVDPYIQERISMLPMPRIGVLDLIPRVMVGVTDIYRFKRETELGNTGYWYSTLSVAVVSGAGATATFNDVDALLEGATVRFHTTGGIEEAEVDSINTTTKVVTFTATLNFDAAIGDPVTCEVWGTTAESAPKPYSYFQLEDATVNLEVIATLMGITSQSIRTIAGLERMIEQKMRRRARQNLTQHVLYGTATGGWLQGFFEYTDALQQLWSTCPAGSNQIDCVLIACETLQANGYMVTAVAMPTRNWGLLTRLKDTNDGQYLRPGLSNGPILTNQPGRLAIGPYPVVLDDRIKYNDFLVLDAMEASVIPDQNTANLAVGYVDDQFVRNEMTMRYEETLAHAIEGEEAFVIGQWDSAP